MNTHTHTHTHTHTVERINRKEGINSLTFIVKKHIYKKQNIFTKNEKATFSPVLLWRVVAVIVFGC